MLVIKLFNINRLNIFLGALGIWLHIKLNVGSLSGAGTYTSIAIVVIICKVVVEFSM
jgi:hypothetical protein